MPNQLYRVPRNSLSKHVYNSLRLDESYDPYRLSLVPRYMSSVVPDVGGWVAPTTFVEGAKAFMAPGFAASGGQVSQDEATNFALNMLGGGLSQRLATRTAMGPGTVGMNAWHGSPHKFDRFDATRIGTGEGAQAYGHGLYFAENPAVARQYQRGAGTFAALKGKAERHGLSVQEYQSRVRSGEITDSNYLYQVDIDDVELQNMLDWDKPLRDQSSKVKESLRQFGIDPDGKHASVTGGEVYNSGVIAPTENKEAISKALREVGIKGMRYLDQGSRATGEGTRNIVLFDESLAQIKKVSE